MALETIIYPQQLQLGQIGNLGYLGYNNIIMLQQEEEDRNNIFGNELLLLSSTTTNNNIYHHDDKESAMGLYSSSSFDDMIMHHVNYKDHLEYWDPNINYSSPEECTAPKTAAALAVGRRKRRRTKRSGQKNKQEIENQRMTHITVERNRRKQMNEYLALIRSLMPSSYVQRGDQASIVGGAINFVKELEQQLQTLEVQKSTNIKGYTPSPPSLSPPFSDFFAFPQYSIHRATDADGGSATMVKTRPRAMAEIEVTMVESHANLKILSKKRQRQLLKMVAGLQCLPLTILHLNVTTIEQMVLYTLSVKLEDGCQLSTVDEIADAVNCLLCRIEEESLCSN